MNVYKKISMISLTAEEKARFLELTSAAAGSGENKAESGKNFRSQVERVAAELYRETEQTVLIYTPTEDVSFAAYDMSGLVEI